MTDRPPEDVDEIALKAATDQAVVDALIVTGEIARGCLYEVRRSEMQRAWLILEADTGRTACVLSDFEIARQGAHESRAILETLRSLESY